MKIKRYEAKDMQEAMLKVKDDLGKDAVIVSTRKIKQKGLLGFFKPYLIEVTAALDEKPKNKDEFLNSLKQTQKMDQLEEKLSSVEGMLSKVYSEIQQTKSSADTEKNNYSNNVIQLFYNHLIDNEVDHEIAKEILDEINADLEKDNMNINNVVRIVYNKLIEILGNPQPIEYSIAHTPRKIVMVGATGVGKTTTIAKLTAEAVLDKKKKVGLITADTYRIAAVEQLKTYAEILGVPVKVVYKPSDITKALADFADKDVVFIDTAGRSHKNEKQLMELQELMAFSEPDETYLVLSLATKYKDIRSILQKYEPIRDYKLIFTKLDETSSSGIILNVRYNTDRPLAYVTTGQNVPDDIEIINTERIVQTLLGRIEE